MLDFLLLPPRHCTLWHFGRERPATTARECALMMMMGLPVVPDGLLVGKACSSDESAVESMSMDCYNLMKLVGNGQLVLEGGLVFLA